MFDLDKKNSNDIILTDIHLRDTLRSEVPPSLVQRTSSNIHNTSTKQKSWWQVYWSKLKAQHIPHKRDLCQVPHRHPYPDHIINICIGFIGSFLSTLGLFYMIFNIPTGVEVLPHSVGASMVLFFASPNSALTQPKNAFLGQIIGAFCGIVARNVVQSPDLNWLAGALAVGFTSVIQMTTNSIYPPGGATALNASQLVILPMWNGFIYVLCPALLMETFMFALALLLNNLSPFRHYPTYWI